MDTLSHGSELKMTTRLVVCGCFLLWANLAVASSADAQAPACAIKTIASSRAALPGGRTVTSAAHTVSRAGDTVVVLGSPTIAWDSVSSGTHREEAFLGFRLAADGRTTLIPAPPHHAGAQEPRGVRAGTGWDMVFFVADSANPGDPEHGENGALWYARLDGTRWSSSRRITPLKGAMIRETQSSALVRHRGRLYFAVGYSPATDSGNGVLLIQRTGDGRWRVDSLPLRYRPFYVTIAPPVARAKAVDVYVATMVWDRGRMFVGSLLATRFASSRQVRLAVRTERGSLGEPRVLPLGSAMLATWWELPTERGATSRLLSARLDPRATTPTSDAELVASGTNEFAAVPLSVAGRPAVLWLYRSPTRPTQEVGAALLIGRRLLQLPPLPVINQGFFRAATAGETAIDLVTVVLPTPGAAGSPAELVTRLVVECARGRL